MDVTVIGCGYVGLVTGTCLASIGHTVRGVEKDLKKLKTLKEGTAVQDCMNPDRIVVGGESPEAFRMMRRLYDPLVKSEENFLTMNWESAELTKYAANSMLAARISFMNEMTILCEAYGADVEDIRKGIGSDSRIGSAFLRAGCGYGGSCFPKDVAAMEHISKAAGHESLFVHAIQTINKEQKKAILKEI